MDELNELKQQIDNLAKSVRIALENEQEVVGLLGRYEDVIQTLQLQIFEQTRWLNNLKYELNDPRTKKEGLFYPVIKSQEEAIDRIVNEGKSLARFGDGEFSIMENIFRQKFQRLDSDLARRLGEVIFANESELLIGIADNYGNLEKYTEQAALAIRHYMTEEVRRMHRKYVLEDREYYDAYLSRPYVLYKDKENAGARFANLQRIWDKRDVIIIEGAQTRIGVGNDLLSNAAKIRRILGPATSSYDRYDEIISAALEFAEKDTLFLIALGPCAGVAAYDLTREGYQAVDIGHVDLEYEWFLNGLEERGTVKNKYNNEFFDGDNVVDDDLPKEYWEQIIANFS